MDVGKAIFGLLDDTANVKALVNNATTGTRIYPSGYRVPTSTTAPFIIYHIVSTTPTNTKNGVSTYDYVVAQISVFAQSYDTCQDLSQKVRNALDYYSGTHRGVVIDKCFFESGSNAFDDSFGDNGIHQMDMDFRFNINL